MSKTLENIKNTEAFKNVDEEDMQNWLSSDNNKPGYETMDEDAVVEEVSGEVSNTQVKHEKGKDECDIVRKKISQQMNLFRFLEANN